MNDHVRLRRAAPRRLTAPAGGSEQSERGGRFISASAGPPQGRSREFAAHRSAPA
ncbi:uncharacterized protein BCN122_II1295 [Burkholderia cenocepacia]|nr:uncharacterized protein BCN122_II1295 [Burkholderia cenocepacia]